MKYSLRELFLVIFILCCLAGIGVQQYLLNWKDADKEKYYIDRIRTTLKYAKTELTEEQFDLLIHQVKDDIYDHY